jgi:hypothetical protein
VFLFSFPFPSCLRSAQLYVQGQGFQGNTAWQDMVPCLRMAGYRSISESSHSCVLPFLRSYKVSPGDRCVSAQGRKHTKANNPVCHDLVFRHHRRRGRRDADGQAAVLCRFGRGVGVHVCVCVCAEEMMQGEGTDARNLEKAKRTGYVCMYVHGAYMSTYILPRYGTYRTQSKIMSRQRCQALGSDALAVPGYIHTVLCSQSG